MGLTAIESSTKKTDEKGNEIIINEMKPCCLFKTSDFKHAQSFGKCCTDAQLTMRGWGPAHSSADPDEAVLDKCIQEKQWYKS